VSKRVVRPPPGSTAVVVITSLGPDRTGTPGVVDADGLGWMNR
jgi:hypothetical protein